MVYHSSSTIPIIHNFSQKKSCFTVFYNGKSAILVLYQQSLPLFGMDICALPPRSAAPLSGGPPPPASEVVSIWSYDYPLSMFTQIRSQCHLTVQVKIGCPTSWLNSLNLSPAAAKVHLPLVLYAALLTQLLAHPLWVSYCLYSKSGLFWAKWLSGQNNIPTMLKIWRVIHSSSSTS